MSNTGARGGRRRSIGLPARVIVAAAAFALVTVAISPPFAGPAGALDRAEERGESHVPARPGTEATVSAEDECLPLHAEPDPAAPVIDCLVDGSDVSPSDDGRRTVGGANWQHVVSDDERGWVDAEQLVFSSTHELSVAPGPTAEPPLAPYGFMAPPAGGLTFGFAAATAPEEVIEAQPFGVRTMTVLDPESQRHLMYIPGAPAFANTLTAGALSRDTIVMLRREGEPGQPLTAAPPSVLPIEPPLIGEPVLFDAPPPGGLTIGVAGTNDVEALTEAQEFPVSGVFAIDVESQSWLIHIDGAPSSVNTLTPANLDPDAFVLMRRVAEPPAEEPPAEHPTGETTAAEPAETEPAASEGVSGGMAPITYYFCERGSNPAGWGDGGGFCGHMASGVRVYEGGAACAREYMGQRFRIKGDPLDRIYTCADTGGGVHGNHRDIFFHNSDDALRWWQAVGSQAEIIIVQ